jgi:F0F1-type ATP synthase assembly protein I
VEIEVGFWPEKRELGSRAPNGGNLCDEKNESSRSPAQKNEQDLKTQSALAMEVPVTIVGAIVLAGFLGYLVDRWLHTSPWLMISGGALGFVSSMIEITQRFRPK